MKYTRTCWVALFLFYHISFSCTRALLSAVCDAETYRMRGWPGSVLDNVGSCWMYSLRSSKAFWCSGPHSKLLEPLSTVKKGKLNLASFDMNLLSVAILPISFWTSFLDYIGFMCIMALILSGLTSIPFIDTRHPNTFPLCTRNTHFSGLSFSWAPHMFVKVSARSSICFLFFLLATTMSLTLVKTFL
jgi:hypothetical protein